MDIDKLLDKAYDGRIQPEELADVADRIQKFYDLPEEMHSTANVRTQMDKDIHTLLQIVGYAGCFCSGSLRIISEYRGLIEKFIIFPRDPFVSTTAFCVLCNDWNFTAEYIPQIKWYIQGVEWDEDGYVRVKAMCIAGSYIKETGDKELLKMLLEMFHNEQEEEFMRKLAYECISGGLGKDWDLPEVAIDTFPQNLIVQETIAKAYELLTKE